MIFIALSGKFKFSFSGICCSVHLPVYISLEHTEYLAPSSLLQVVILHLPVYIYTRNMLLLPVSFSSLSYTFQSTFPLNTRNMLLSSSINVSCRNATRMSGTLVREMSFPATPSLV
uniref:Uncharacterized protein n=1 Tax=Cacopsylla melanoneura TaxID=428564 RepID=A0A8D9F2V3_9HEMI